MSNSELARLKYEDGRNYPSQLSLWRALVPRVVGRTKSIVSSAARASRWKRNPTQLGKPTDIEVSSGETHKLEVYFNVFPNNLLRVCGAEMEIAALREGEVHSLEYFVELKDRYLNRGHLKPLIGS